MGGRPINTFAWRQNSPGLSKFNFEDLKIINTSDGNYTCSQSFVSVARCGKGIDNPTYGTWVVVILLGEGDLNHVVSFNNITIYDKSDVNWYSQLAFGNLSQPRSDFCIVGIQGTTESDSFEILGPALNANCCMNPSSGTDTWRFLIKL